MICCVIPSSSLMASFKSIHDTLQEIWAIENSTILTPKFPLDMDTSAVNRPKNKMQYCLPLSLPPSVSFLTPTF